MSTCWFSPLRSKDAPLSFGVLASISTTGRQRQPRSARPVIYRLLVDYPDPQNEFLSSVFEFVAGAVPIPWSKRIARRLAGGSNGRLAVVMFARGLRSPSITNRRARFYFTERGWRKVGRHVTAEARRMGHVVKVIRCKEPDRSQVIYRDNLQLALLPRKSVG